MKRALLSLGPLVLAAACGSAPPATDAGALDASADAAAGSRAQSLAAVKAYVAANLDLLQAAADELQKAAPAPDGDGWSDAADHAAVEAMKAAWAKARQAQEHLESALRVLFPRLEVGVAGRYEDFLEIGADDNLFDGTGVSGLHAIERILWAEAPRPEVVAFERGLTGYRPAAVPRTSQEASAFKDGLCARLVTDVTMMRELARPLGLDTAAAYSAVIRAVTEPIEALSQAGTGEEESRYANQSLADLRAGLEAGLATQRAFAPWLATMPGGSALDDRITAGFQRLSDAMGPGTQLPPVPVTWTAAHPSPEDLATPFGQLFTLFAKESDPKDPTSVISAAAQAAGVLGVKGDFD
jgi:iron uptake system component EfeO